MRALRITAAAIAAIATPAAAAAATIYVGQASGTGAVVAAVNGATGASLGSFQPFGPSAAGGVSVAAGDGVADLVVGALPGNRVAVFAGGQAGSRVGDFVPFAAGYTGGAHVAAGPLDGDGRADLAVGSALGSAVRLFDGDTGAPRGAYTPFGIAHPFGTVVAAGNVNASVATELVVGTGAGAPSVVAVLDLATGQQLTSFLPFGPGFSGGMSVATGDVDGDGRAEIVVGAGAGGAPIVSVFDGTTFALERSFLAFDAAFAGGVNVAAGDVNGDGLAEVIAGTASIASQVRVFDGATGGSIASYLPLGAGSTTGVTVAVAVPEPSALAALAVAAVALRRRQH